MNLIEVPKMIPSIKPPIPNNEYYIGADFCSKDNVSHFSVFNKTTNMFEHQVKLFTSSEADFDSFCEAISKYFDADLLKEKQT